MVIKGTLVINLTCTFIAIYKKQNHFAANHHTHQLPEVHKLNTNNLKYLTMQHILYSVQLSSLSILLLLF